MQNYTINFCDSVSLDTNNVNVGSINASATICNKNTGQILFYTNGTQVLNVNLQQMPNGNNLAGDYQSEQVALIVPQPGSNHIYYIFTTDRYGDTPNALEYSIVDMNKDGGLGDVTVKNVFLDSTTEKLNGVYNFAGNFFWVIALNPSTNNFMSFKLDSAGLDTIPVLSPSHTDVGNTFQRAGYLRSSPNGKNIVVVFEYPYLIGLYHFNKDSGNLKLRTFLPLESQDADALSASFSPDNSKLYLTGDNSTNNVSEIYQFDITNNDTNVIKASRIKLSTVGYNNAFTGLQLGPDQKIYVGRYYLDSLTVIEKPNLAGIACQFMLNKIATYTQFNVYNGGFSNNIDGLYYFADTNNINLTYKDTCNKGILFTINTARGYNYFAINLGDGRDTLLDSTQYTFKHWYDSAGTYSVKLTTASGCNIQDSVTISVTVDTAKCPVPPPPTPSLIIPTIIYSAGGQTKWHILNLPEGNNSVTLYDELGQVIYKSLNYPNDYDMRMLPPAMYFYRLTLENGEVHIGKVVVVK